MYVCVFVCVCMFVCLSVCLCAVALNALHVPFAAIFACNKSALHSVHEKPSLCNRATVQNACHDDSVRNCSVSCVCVINIVSRKSTELRTADLVLSSNYTQSTAYMISAQTSSVKVYTVSQKNCATHYTFVYNFDKCWPIFKILSQFHCCIPLEICNKTHAILPTTP